MASPNAFNLTPLSLKAQFAESVWACVLDARVKLLVDREFPGTGWRTPLVLFYSNVGAKCQAASGVFSLSFGLSVVFFFAALSA